MAIVVVTTSPTTLDAGTSEFVTVTNTGTVDVTVVRGSQSFVLRPTQGRTVYPEGAAVTASVVSGSGQVTTTAQAAQVTQAQQVTANTAAIAGLPGTYAQPGVILAGAGIDPTGASDSTAATQALINSVPTGGTLYVPLGTYKITASLNIPRDMSILGAGATALTGSPDTPTGVGGAVLLMTTAATDAVSATGQRRVNVKNLAVKFDSSISGNTGHGFKFDVSASAGGNTGLTGGVWENVIVYGHDGNHYAFWFNCPLHNTTTRLQSYGGGGFYHAQTGNSTINAGNCVHTNPVAMVLNQGTAAGFAQEVATGKVMNFNVWIRPQVNMVSNSGTQHRWNDAVGAVYPIFQTLIQPDLEPTSAIAPVIAPDSTIVGRVYGVTLYDQPTRVGSLALSGGNTSTVAVGVGYQALAANTSGDQLTAIGYKALAGNTTGSFSTAVGYQALITQSGAATLNTAVGRLAGQSVTTGYENVLIGSGAGQAGTALTTGGDNTLVGHQAQVAAAGALQATALGANAKAANNNATALGAGANAAGNGSVAIGRDQAGTAASTTVQNEIALGTANHQVKISNNTTGAGSAALGANCPATTATAPYTWMKMTSSDGSTVYVPAWK